MKPLLRTPQAAILWLAVALVLLIPLAVSIGAVRIPLRATFLLLTGGAVRSASPDLQAQRVILFQIRLPRVLSAGLIGAALSVGGLLYQGLFRNAMADPYVIGASGGAALGAALALTFPAFALFGFSAVATMAFVFSIATVLTVYSLARVNGRVVTVSLLLAGLAFSAMLEFATWFLTSLDRAGVTALRLLGLWLHGAVSTPTYPQLAASAMILILCFLLAVPMTARLNTLALGDEQARSLGLRVEWTRAGIIVAGSLLTAIAVSLGGIIGFVGLIVPHFLRLLVGPDHKRLLPLSALGGAIFLIISDTVARTALAPSEMPVGVLTAFIGGPAFLYLLRRNQQESVA